MGKLKGITITLINKVETGKDPLGMPIYEDKEIDVANVLVSPINSTDVASDLELYGKYTVYELAIPKGDTNNWINQEVKFFGERWRTVGEPTQGIEALIPLAWNRKVRVEKYV